MLVALALSLGYKPTVRSAARQHVAARQHAAARRCAAPRGQQRSISISTEKLQLGDGQVATTTPPPHHHHHTTTTTLQAQDHCHDDHRHHLTRWSSSSPGSIWPSPAKGGTRSMLKAPSWLPPLTALACWGRPSCYACPSCHHS